MPKTDSDGQTFGSRLLVQRNATGLVANLMAGAKADRKFPKYGTPGDVRKHLPAMQADDALFEAVDEAETDRLSY